MTRTKRHRCYIAGEREYCWAKAAPTKFIGESADGLVLTGSLKDVGLGWAMEQGAFNVDPGVCQAYVDRMVRIADRITLGGKGTGESNSLMHQDASGKKWQIGFLFKKRDKGSPNTSLEVSAVIRFALKPADLAKESLADSVRKRGGGYAVLVSGRLR